MLEREIKHIDKAISMSKTLRGMIDLAHETELWNVAVNPYMVSNPPFESSYDELMEEISGYDLAVLQPKLTAWLQEIKVAILKTGITVIQDDSTVKVLQSLIDNIAVYVDECDRGNVAHYFEQYMTAACKDLKIDALLVSAKKYY